MPTPMRALVPMMARSSNRVEVCLSVHISTLKQYRGDELVAREGVLVIDRGELFQCQNQSGCI